MTDFLVLIGSFLVPLIYIFLVMKFINRNCCFNKKKYWQIKERSCFKISQDMLIKHPHGYKKMALTWKLILYISSGNIYFHGVLSHTWIHDVGVWEIACSSPLHPPLLPFQSSYFTWLILKDYSVILLIKKYF